LCIHSRSCWFLIIARIKWTITFGLPYAFRIICFRLLVIATAMACVGVLIKGAKTYAIQNFYAKETLDPDAGSYKDHIFDDNELLCLKVNTEPIVDCDFVR